MNPKVLLSLISLKLNVYLHYFIVYKKVLNLKKPKLLDEKIQWMKFYFYKNNPLITKCVDKYAVREYVDKCGCSEILNQLYATYDTVEEINWASVPNKFVMKWNFGCGQNLICRNKSDLNLERTNQILKKWLKVNDYFYRYNAELQYKNITPKLVCESLIETADGSLPIDYKVYCFNGKAKYLMLCIGRELGCPKFYFVDETCNLVRLNKTGLNAPENLTIPKPEGFDLLFKYANILAKPFPFVRADFYLNNGNVIFGELTFTPSGGIDPNIPYEQNLLLGSLIDLKYRG